MADSMEAEIIALAAMIGGIIGIILALYGYLGLSILRLMGFLLPDNDERQD